MRDVNFHVVCFQGGESFFDDGGLSQLLAHFDDVASGASANCGGGGRVLQVDERLAGQKCGRNEQGGSALDHVGAEGLDALVKSGILQTAVYGAFAEARFGGGLGYGSSGGQRRQQDVIPTTSSFGLGAGRSRTGRNGSRAAACGPVFQGQEAFFQVGVLAQAQPHVKDIPCRGAAYVGWSGAILQRDQGMD